MKQKTILVTGATSGIGLATAQHFVNQGHRVVITGRNKTALDKTAEHLGALVIPVQCDNEQMAHIKQLGTTLQDLNIQLNAAVLNAGVFMPCPFAEVGESHYDREMNINTKGTFFTLQNLLPVLNNPSSVVFVSSIAATEAFAGGSVYSASKAALESMMGALNIELAHLGIRINSMRPGITATKIQAKAGMDDEAIQALHRSQKQQPLGRILQPEDIVTAISYLTSDDAIGIRNSSITMDGGYGLLS